MRKQEFLDALREKLCGLPRADIEERLSFYGEMIDDRIEEGLLEEDAVSQIGSVDGIIAQIVADTPLVKIARERIRPKKRLGAGVSVLLVLGSPIWLSLLIAAFAVVLSLYVTLWAVFASLWAVFASLACCAPCGVIAGAVFAVTGNVPAGIVIAAAGVACAGLAILAFFGCKAATRGMLLWTKRMALATKKALLKKEVAQ